MAMPSKTIFITGTDTGAGKTLLTALLLYHLRSAGCCALALKPFCSGSRADAELLHILQNGDVALDDVNPFYFREPVAPLISARKHRRHITLNQVVQRIHTFAQRVSDLAGHPPTHPGTQNSKLKTHCCLLIEGSGGLLVPLGQDYTVRDLICRLHSDVIVVARNKLGTINHTLLTVESLQAALRTPHSALSVVLMDVAAPDPSCTSNTAILRELLFPVPVVQIPFLGPRSNSFTAVQRNARAHAKVLTEVLRSHSVSRERIVKGR